MEKRDNEAAPMLPVPEENSLFKVSEENIDTVAANKYPTEALPRVAESRPIVGSYQQKQIPYRSASFSHGDHSSSSKYFRSALGALKASLTRSKSPPIPENSNLTLPPKDRSRSASPEPRSVAKNEDTNIWIPLKPPTDKRNDLNLNLLDVSAISNVIMEEDNENSPISDMKDFSIPKPPPMPPKQVTFC